jgi:hypothetical protein
MKHFLVSILILLTTLSWCNAQSSRESKKEFPAMNTAGQAQVPVETPAHPLSLGVLQFGPTVTLPPEKDSWAIQMITRGGFFGGGKGDLIITSRGDIFTIQKSTEHNFKLSNEQLQNLTKLLAATKPSEWPTTTNSLCKDCYVTVLTFYRRTAGGIQRQATVTWDDSTADNLPFDLKQLYLAAEALGTRAGANHPRKK